MELNRQTRLWIRLCTVILSVVCLILIKDTEVDAASYRAAVNDTVTIPDSQSYPNTGSYSWISYRPAENGYVRVQAQYGSSRYTYSLGYWQFYAANRKKALSADRISYTTKPGTDSFARTTCFAVKKRTTYYLRVQPYDGVKINFSFHKVKDQSGSRRSKACSIARSGKYQGTILSGQKKKDWYRIRQKKTRKINFEIQVKSDGKFKFTVYNGTGKKLGSMEKGYTAKSALRVEQKDQSSGHTSGVRAGTYYLSVEPVDSYSNGYYSVKWK